VTNYALWYAAGVLVTAFVAGFCRRTVTTADQPVRLGVACLLWPATAVVILYVLVLVGVGHLGLTLRKPE
jgi:uncharacterized membrane protein YhdT